MHVVGLAQELAGERVLVDADRGAADLHVDARELEVRVERDRVDGLDHDVEAHGPREAEVVVPEEALEAPATRNGPHQRPSRVRRARFGRDVVRATRENTHKQTPSSRRRSKRARIASVVIVSPKSESAHSRGRGTSVYHCGGCHRPRASRPRRGYAAQIGKYRSRFGSNDQSCARAGQSH